MQNYLNIPFCSISLVFWEIMQRVNHKNISAKPYAMPYDHMVPSDPTIEDMKNIVLDQRKRPTFDHSLGKFSVEDLLFN